MNSNENAAEVLPGRRLIVTRGSEVTPEALVWWEFGLVLMYAINLVAAREGNGKSTVASSWAAKETKAGGIVLWIGTEESRAAAVIPRLMAAGADLDRIIFIDVEAVTGGSALMFPLDLKAIEEVIKAHGVTMMILDPAKAVVPPGFSGNDDIAVRQYLEPIADLADRVKVTVIGLVHFGKREGSDSGRLMLGSVAWSQVARCVLSIAENPDTGTRVLTNTKVNYIVGGTSQEFRINSTPVDIDGQSVDWGTVEWLGATDLDARHLLARSADGDADEFDTRDYTDDLKASWLYAYLAAARNAKTAVRPKDAVSYGADQGRSRAAVFRLFEKLQNAGFAQSVASTGFPRTTHWEVVMDATTGSGAPDGETTETAETAGADQAKHRETAGRSDNGGETTAKTLFDQEKHDANHSVVSVVSPISAHTAPATVTDLDSRRSRETEREKVPCRVWFEEYVSHSIANGKQRLDPFAVITDGASKGYSTASVRSVASAHPGISAIWVDGTTAWSLVGETQPSAPEVITNYLDGLPADVTVVDQADFYAFTAERGITPHTARKVLVRSGRVESTPAHGNAKSDRIWRIIPAADTDEVTA